MSGAYRRRIFALPLEINLGKSEIFHALNFWWRHFFWRTHYTRGSQAFFSATPFTNFTVQSQGWWSRLNFNGSGSWAVA